MKVLITGPKTEYRDALCKILKRTYPDIEIVVDVPKKTFEGYFISTYGVEESATLDIESIAFKQMLQTLEIIAAKRKIKRDIIDE